MHPFDTCAHKKKQSMRKEQVFIDFDVWVADFVKQTARPGQDENNSETNNLTWAWLRKAKRLDMQHKLNQVALVLTVEEDK
jgi:hypothetical protein